MEHGFSVQFLAGHPTWAAVVSMYVSMYNISVGLSLVKSCLLCTCDGIAVSKDHWIIGFNQFEQLYTLPFECCFVEGENYLRKIIYMKWLKTMFIIVKSFFETILFHNNRGIIRFINFAAY